MAPGVTCARMTICGAAVPRRTTHSNSYCSPAPNVTIKPMGAGLTHVRWADLADSPIPAMSHRSCGLGCTLIRAFLRPSLTATNPSRWCSAGASIERQLPT
jgi:hypothetical protein